MKMKIKQGIKLELKHADLTSREDLEAMARMEIEMKRELRPRFDYYSSDSELFEECVKGIENVDKNVRRIIAHVKRYSLGYIEYFLNNGTKLAEGRLLYVYSEFRRLGVGSALISARNEDAKRRGYRMVKTDVNLGLYNFFLKNGFTKVSANTDDSRMILKLK